MIAFVLTFLFRDFIIGGAACLGAEGADFENGAAFQRASHALLAGPQHSRAERRNAS